MEYSFAVIGLTESDIIHKIYHSDSAQMLSKN